MRNMNNHKTFPDPPARLHFIGIKGVAMTALAEIMKGQGYEISGSDVDERFQTDNVLKKLGISFIEGFSKDNIAPDTGAVIYSTAYEENHIERKTASARGLPTWSYPEVAALLFQIYQNGIAVAGSHGKTTTAAILSSILIEAGLDPTAIIGSTVTNWGSNAKVGKSQWFILEADEYQNKLGYYNPRFVLLTNIDYDHPDYFQSESDYEKVFLDFVEKIPNGGALIVWGGEPFLSKLREITKAPIITYGAEKNNDWQLSNVRISDRGTEFAVCGKDGINHQFIIPYPGFHYALNACGAIALASYIGIAISIMQKAIALFQGTARRLEKYGEYNGAIIIDDYAHHPTEIKATLLGLKERYAGRNLICAFHPHTYTRTAQIRLLLYPFGTIRYYLTFRLVIPDFEVCTRVLLTRSPLSRTFSTMN